VHIVNRRRHRFRLIIITSMTSASSSRFVLMVNFGLVYVFWGSTYLGIDIAVEHIPPALMCATRFTIAGTIMLAYCLAAGHNIRYSWRELVQLAVVGNLLLMGGNLTLSYAEQYIPSGLAALLVASIPLWFLILDSLMLGHHQVSARGLLGLGLGLATTLNIIQSHKASIDVQTDVNQGSNFILKFERA